LPLCDTVAVDHFSRALSNEVMPALSSLLFFDPVRRAIRCSCTNLQHQQAGSSAAAAQTISSAA
jgi:hypothetical protein